MQCMLKITSRVFKTDCIIEIFVSYNNILKVVSYEHLQMAVSGMYSIAHCILQKQLFADVLQNRCF